VFWSRRTKSSNQPFSVRSAKETVFKCARIEKLGQVGRLPLEEATKIIETEEITDTTTVLQNLGYKITWHGISPEKAEITRPASTQWKRALDKKRPKTMDFCNNLLSQSCYKPFFACFFKRQCNSWTFQTFFRACDRDQFSRAPAETTRSLDMSIMRLGARGTAAVTIMLQREVWAKVEPSKLRMPI
jgi:hypothetical protein